MARLEQTKARLEQVLARFEGVTARFSRLKAENASLRADLELAQRSEALLRGAASDALAEVDQAIALIVQQASTAGEAVEKVEPIALSAVGATVGGEGADESGLDARLDLSVPARDDGENEAPEKLSPLSERPLVEGEGPMASRSVDLDDSSDSEGKEATSLAVDEGELGDLGGKRAGQDASESLDLAADRVASEPVPMSPQGDRAEKAEAESLVASINQDQAEAGLESWGAEADTQPEDDEAEVDDDHDLPWDEDDVENDASDSDNRSTAKDDEDGSGGSWAFLDD